jgi:hypothetical protein
MHTKTQAMYTCAYGPTSADIRDKIVYIRAFKYMSINEHVCIHAYKHNIRTYAHTHINPHIQTYIRTNVHTPIRGNTNIKEHAYLHSAFMQENRRTSYEKELSVVGGNERAEWNAESAI